MENSGGKDSWYWLDFDGRIGRDGVFDYRYRVSCDQKRHRVGPTALGVAAITDASMAAVGMAGMYHDQQQHRQEDESYQEHARTAGPSR